MNIEPTLFFEAPKSAEPVGITLTDTAVTHIRVQLDERSGDTLGIRFGVTGAGCGGYTYTVEFVDKDSGEDHVFEQNNIKIFVDKKSILLIDGMQVNFATNGFNSGLEFTNPIATNCGCGESFSV